MKIYFVTFIVKRRQMTGIEYFCRKNIQYLKLTN